MGAIRLSYGAIAQLARAPVLHTGGRRFDSGWLHQAGLAPFLSWVKSTGDGHRAKIGCAQQAKRQKVM